MHTDKASGKKNIVSREELVRVQDALKSAVRTDVIEASSSLATLVYFVFQVFGGRGLIKM